MITLGKAGRLSAEDALRISLVSEVVAPDHLLDRARELTAEAAKASPTTLPGLVATDIAVSAGPGRNWAVIWKPLIDAFAPAHWRGFRSRAQPRRRRHCERQPASLGQD